MLRRLALVLVLATATLAAGCGSSSPPRKPGVVRVVAAENFWGDIAKQIGGNHVQVTSIITNPETDPHLYESDPRDAAAIAAADIVIENDLGYDTFIQKTLDAVGGHDERVLVASDLLGIGFNGETNPHVWYATARLYRFADAIAKDLSQIDPSDREVYAAAAARFDASLKPLLAVIATIKREYSGAPVGYTERLPGYLLDAAHLEVETPLSFAQAIEDGNDPSPGDTLTFDSLIRAHKIKVLIYNAQVVDAATERLKQLATSSGIPVVGMTETMPAGTTFQAWQLHQDRELLRALRG